MRGVAVQALDECHPVSRRSVPATTASEAALIARFGERPIQITAQLAHKGMKMNVPEGFKLVPIEPTHEIIKAMAESRAKDDEGVYPAMCDLIGFSGENATHTALKAAYAAAVAAAPAPAVVQAEVSDAQVSAAARVLADRSAEACNVDKDDNWKVYGQDFIDDARAALIAARGAA